MNNFCVIGAHVSRQWDRKWFASEDDAVTHATGIAQRAYVGNQKPVQLFVVERKRVVEIGMPETVVREPSDKDDASPVSAPAAPEADDEDD